MGKEKRKKYSCDFETTTNPDDCRVWAYGWMEIGNRENFHIGNNLDEFMQWAKETQADLYFHNLRFDGEFIVNWLLKNGYTYSKEGTANTFNVIISRMGQWYMIDICYGNKGTGKRKQKLHTVIYDSLKKLPFPVKKIAKDFKLHVEKGDIDYHAERPIGHQITDEEFVYIKNDIEIIATALETQFNEGLTKMTNGSDALNGFKQIITPKLFSKHFPVLHENIDVNIRQAYKGGFTWLNEKYAGKEIGEGMVFDVNSLYPSVMYNRPLPYGMPLPFVGEYKPDKLYPLFIQHIRCEFELKEGHIPTIQLKKNGLFKGRGNEYLKDSEGEIVDLYVTSVDWELIQKHYHVYDVSFHKGYKFRQKVGLFKDYIDHWMEIKIKSTGAVKLLAKLMLNSLYGKFASNPDVTGKYPYLKPDGSTGFAVGEKETKDPVYTPMGAFITAYARELTISTAQKCFDRIIYCDTDSIHLTGTEIPDVIKDVVDDDKLGYWAHESNYKRAKYIRQKTYVQDIYTGDGEETYLSVKCAGMPDNVKKKVDFDNFNIDFQSDGKLMPKHVNGGVVLVDTTFSIK